MKTGVHHPGMKGKNMKTALIQITGAMVAAVICNGGEAVNNSGNSDNTAGWPPLPDRGNTHTKSLDGRIIERFTHQSRSQWGYEISRQNYFFLVHPKKVGANAPLCVVLHSANRSALDYLGYYFLNRKVDPADNPSDTGEKVPADFYTLFLDSNNDEFWGWTTARRDRAQNSKEPTPAEIRVLNTSGSLVNVPGKLEPTPTENRVLDTIEWVAMKYNIDRNRIYLTGVSMGGCGSLGIGLPHGDVFAAMRVWVPAGTGYVSCRMGFAPPPPADAPKAQKDAWSKAISKAGLPDPPLVVDLSAQNDGWSGDQAVLLNAAREGHLPLIVGWGPFGHTGAYSPVAKYPRCADALALPWMEIRKNEAYPVFTHASSDQRPPWLNKPGEFDESGQINAYFRWKSVTDTPSAFAMRLWLEHPATDNSPPGVPQESVADITLRRLQQFKVVPDKSYAWRLVCGEKSVASGVIEPDAAGLLTIPNATITVAPAELHLKPQ